MENVEIIDAYLKNKMSADEKAAFEEKVYADDDLAYQVEKHRFALEAIEYTAKEKAKKAVSTKLKSLRVEIMEEDEAEQKRKAARIITVKQRRRFFIVSLAVAFLLLIVFFFYINQPPTHPLPAPPPVQLSPQPIDSISNDTTKTKPIAVKPPTPPEDKKTPKPQDPKPVPPRPQPNYIAVVENYYTIPEQLKSSQLKSSPDEINNQIDTTLFQRGTKAFKKKQYKNVITILSQIRENDSLFVSTQNWLAHAYFNNQQFGQAALIFQEIAKTSRMRSKARAEWYWLLSMIPNYQKNKEEINRLLKYMTDDEQAHIYQRQAEELAIQLKQ